MNQPNKKSSPQQASAKLASIAGKAAKSGFDSAVESTRSSAENVVKIGSSAMKEFIATGTGEAQKAQEKAFALGRESAESLAKSADSVSKMMYEVIGLQQGNIETCLECSNITASLAKDLSTEAFESANQAFSDTVEIAKEFFTCRTINDMAELQNRLVRRSLDQFFTESMKLSDRLFDYTTQTMEPINERVASASEQLNKALAA